MEYIKEILSYFNKILFISHCYPFLGFKIVRYENSWIISFTNLFYSLVYSFPFHSTLWENTLNARLEFICQLILALIFLIPRALFHFWQLFYILSCSYLRMQVHLSWASFTCGLPDSNVTVFCLGFWGCPKANFIFSSIGKYCMAAGILRWNVKKTGATSFSVECDILIVFLFINFTLELRCPEP